MSRSFADVLGSNQAAAKDSAWISRWSRTIVVSRLPFSSRVAAKRGDNFLQADLNEAARAADASREANGAVYGERLK